METLSEEEKETLLKNKTKERWCSKESRNALNEDSEGPRETEGFSIPLFGEFDPGSGRTLAARLTHAGRTERARSLLRTVSVADG